MRKTLLNLWRSIFFNKSRVVPGLTCYGTANEFLDISEVPGHIEDRSKFGSFKLVVDHIEGELVYFYCYLVTSEGFEHISSPIRKTNRTELARRVKNLSLIVESEK